MTGQVVAHIIEGIMCASPFVLIPLMVWRDPANLYAAEVKRREASRG